MPISDELLDYLKSNLSIEIENGDFIDPNRRWIILKLDNEQISSASFDVVQKPEYEG
jgi:hypothetical protein